MRSEMYTNAFCASAVKYVKLYSARCAVKYVKMYAARCAVKYVKLYAA